MRTDDTLDLDDETFDACISRMPCPVVVNFWADWCTRCKKIAPTLEQIASDLEDRIVVARVNVEESSDLASRFGIRQVPTLVFFKNGRAVDQLVGAAPKEEILRHIEAHLDGASKVAG